MQSTPTDSLQPHLVLRGLAAGVEAEVVEDLGFQSADGLQERHHQGRDVGLQQLACLLADLQDGRQSAPTHTHTHTC